MQAKITRVLTVLLVAAVATTVYAAPKGKKEHKAAKAHDPAAKFFKGVTLTEEQQTKVNTIVAEHKEAVNKAKQAKDKAALKTAMKDLHTDLMSVLTDEQKTELKEARAKAKAAHANKPKAEKRHAKKKAA